MELEECANVHIGFLLQEGRRRRRWLMKLVWRVMGCWGLRSGRLMMFEKSWMVVGKAGRCFQGLVCTWSVDEWCLAGW
jgi:hypothetical protein